MIIEEAVKEVEIVGEDTSKKAKISQDKLAKLQYLLTKGLYKDPITAVIAEWTNNGVDGVVQAGKDPIENPVMVTINKNEKGQYFFSVEDKGTGLDDRDFEDVCMNYLESTKEGDNDTIGHFGIGMKSFLSLERSATFTCRKNGVERKYLVYEGTEFVNFTLIHEKDTQEENGVIAELVINGWTERQQFIDKAKAKLAYYDTVVLVVDGQPIQNNIHRNELFQWSTLNRNNNIHIALKDVYYTLDYEALGITPIPLPIAIRLQLNDGLTPTPSRESYITNDRVKQLILKKIKDIAEWFVNRYNATVKEFPTFMDAYDYLGNSQYKVPLGTTGESFVINPITKFTTIKVLEPKVKGLTIKDGLWYKNKKHHMLTEYTDAAYLDYTGKMKSKERWHNKELAVFGERKKPILVGDNFVGNVKTYLKAKYIKDAYFVKKNGKIRHLGGREDNKKHVGLDTPDSYYNTLDLHFVSKHKWRDNIAEWNLVVSSITSTFIDETDVENTKVYKDWLEKKQADQKAKRLQGATAANYSGLNKQQGDVTLAYSYQRYGKVHFKKEAVKISSLAGNKFKTVLLTEEEVDDELRGTIRLSKSPHVKFAVVGKLERKKIPDYYQFITLKQYRSMDSKPFMRLASAILFQRAVEDYKKLCNRKEGLFAMCVKPLKDDVDALDKYQGENLLDCGETATESAILQVAEENKLYDLQLWDVYQRVRAGLKKYDFINLLQEPNYYDDEHKKRYNTIVNQMLLFRKKFYNDLEDAEIVFNPKAKV